MNEIFCDLYFPMPFNDNIIKIIEILDKNFKYDETKLFKGYLGISVERLKLIPLIDLLNKKQSQAISVPIKYREKITIDIDEAFMFAKKAKLHKGLKVVKNAIRVKHTPLYWSFGLELTEGYNNGFVPNNIYVDKIDGHLWSMFEFDSYWYDFNNKF